MNKTKLGFKNLCLPVFILFMGIGVQILISCSSSGGGDTPTGGGSISSGTEDPALYCVVEVLGYCVTGLSGKQCRDDGYRGNNGYSDTKCPSGYDIITKVEGTSSSSSGGSSLNRDYCVVENTFNGVVTGVCIKHFEDCDVYGNSGRWSNNCPKDYTCVDYLNSVSCDNNSSSSSSSSIGNVISSSSSIRVSSSSSSIGNIISSSSSVGVNVSSSSVGCAAAYNPATHYCSNGTMKEYGILTDSRSNPPQTYKTVVIDIQTWMAENLNYNVTNSKCYNNDPANCAKYGRLYNWNTAMNNSASSITNPSGVQGVCPAGWHLPSRAEWNDLVNYAGGSSSAGKNLKSNRDWVDSYINNDNYGFSALPGGYGNSNGSFGDVGDDGYWWSASEYDSQSAYHRYMERSTIDRNDRVYEYNDDKSYLLSVRCVKD